MCASSCVKANDVITTIETPMMDNNLPPYLSNILPVNGESRPVIIPPDMSANPDINGE